MEVHRSAAVMRRAVAVIAERETATIGGIELKPESNMMQRVAFKRSFAAPPFVFYSVMCADCNFGIAHYIKSIGQGEFVLCIENQTPEPRVISIMYDAQRME